MGQNRNLVALILYSVLMLLSLDSTGLSFYYFSFVYFLFLIIKNDFMFAILIPPLCQTWKPLYSFCHVSTIFYTHPKIIHSHILYSIYIFWTKIFIIFFLVIKNKTLLIFINKLIFLWLKCKPGQSSFLFCFNNMNFF